MVIAGLVTVFVHLALVGYVAWRRFSVVEQEITFATDQRGVVGVTLVIQEDRVRRLRIIYHDGQICEVFPAAAERTVRAAPSAGTL